MNAVRQGTDPREFYREFRERLEAARQATGLYRPLTYVEKILLAHLHNPGTQEWDPGEATLLLTVDHVALQDATAQMALLQVDRLRRGGVLQRVALSASIHPDHLIVAEHGADHDMQTALVENQEVYTFLGEASAVLGLRFTRPGEGIIHQVVLEQFAAPGMIILGTDSHTPNAGGMGCLASGVGGTEAAVVLAGHPWNVLHPKRIGVHLTGRLRGFASAKDVITRLCSILTTKGGTDNVIEYFGPGVASLSATGRATICNMGAEVGATGSVFPVDLNTVSYLRDTGRGGLADLVEQNLDLFQADPEVLVTPNSYFDQIIEINLAELEPHVVGPHKPDLGRYVSALKAELTTKDWPVELSGAYVGSCTNSSREDIAAVAAICQQALDQGLKLKVPLFLSPGSKRTLETVRRLGYLDILKRAGVTLLANACGPCIGQLRRPDAGVNSVVTSFNRNFPKRLDGRAGTHVFITSPAMVAMYAYAGRLDFNPSVDSITTEDGTTDIMFHPLSASDMPTGDFAPYVEPDPFEADDIVVSPDSTRLKLLDPFEKPNVAQPMSLLVLGKMTGDTTTDAISPAGSWLTWRGHLPNISRNFLLGGINAFTGDVGKVNNVLADGVVQTPFEYASYLQALGVPWCVVGGVDYGSGSSREHAAMTPRFLGGRAVIAKSFARIHRSNLALQGIVPLTFVNEADYDRIREGDMIHLPSLQELAPKTLVLGRIEHQNGEMEEVVFQHTLTEHELEGIRAGSFIDDLIAKAKAA